jgi:selenocysteine lyase/cysteine desulfurase
VERALAQRRISLVVCTHLSNLCGLTLPVAGIGALCRKYGAGFIIDASQSAGRIPLSLEDCGADAICAPGHKGLYGLQGSGFALFSERCAADAGSLRVFLSGGNGVNSREAVMPLFLPERFEAGTLPAPALAALAEGIRTVRRIGPEAIGAYEDDLGDRLRARLSGIGGVTLYAPETGGGTVLFNVAGLPSETVGEALDRAGICVRCGFHCCPLGHRTLDTGEGGAVRASVSMFTGKRDVDALAEEVGKLRRSL